MSKDTEGKLELRLVYKSLIDSIAKVRTHGIKKYLDPDDWRTNNVEVYFDALLRHIFAANDYFMGGSQSEEYDKESGFDHLAHAACNLMFLIEAKAGNEEVKEDIAGKGNEIIRMVGEEPAHPNCLSNIIEVKPTRKKK